MEYYIIETELDNKYSRLERYEFPEYFSIGNTTSGDRYDDTFIGKIWNDNPNQTLSDFLWGPVHLSIVSSKLKNVFESFETNIQFFPVSVISTNKEIEYWHINLLNNVNAIDWINSKYVARSRVNDKLIKWDQESVPEQIPDLTSIKKMISLALNQDKISNRNIFRLKYFNNHIICTDKVEDELSKLELSGVKITPIKEYFNKEDWF